MNTFALVDPVSGIGTVAPITQFANITPSANDPENKSDFDWKDGYIARQVDPLRALLGWQQVPQRFAKALDDAGVAPDEVITLVAHLPEKHETGRVSSDIVAEQADELWVVAYNRAGNGDYIDLRQANLIRVL